ncbi:MAG TPA: MYXO-CTERM sorting domain-containing protein [Kofleriaceae bacterium]
MRKFAAVGFVAACALVAACGDKQTPVIAATDGGEVVNLAAHDISAPLREMVKMPQVAPEHDADEYEPVRMVPHPHMRAVPKADPVVQSAMGIAPAIPLGASFEGQGAGMPGFQPGGVPPDTDGDVGPNDYVQVVNTSLTVFSRTGTVKLGPSPTGSVFTGFNGACGQSNDGDATVRYDHLADRWVVAQFSIGNNANGPYYQCVAVSTTPDPTGTYARYQFNYNALNDYPKVGLWPDGYYFTFNMFGTQSFQGGKVCAMDRVKMLAGDASATMQCFDAGQNYGGLLASDVDGHNPPPAGSPNYVIALDQDTAHAFWKLHVDWTTPASSTFTGPTAITAASYSLICNGGGSCITQPTGGAQLASLGDRAMNRFVYRRFADHESLLLTHTVSATTGSGIRWYEIRSPSTTPTVFQQGTYAPDGAFRWIPSIAMDASGDIAVVYSVSSSTIKPSVRIAAHAVTDPPGMFGAAESPVVDGKSVQTSIDRWGDYAALNIDPVDDCTFWATQEYHGATSNGQGNWSTRIASFILPTCGSFALPNVTDETVAQNGTASYPVATMTTAGAAQTLTLDTTGLPTGVTATFTPANVQSGTSAMITLAADATAPLGATHYTITATSPTNSAMTDVNLTVTAPQAPDAGNGNDGNGGQSGGCCETSAGSSPYGSILIAGLVLGVGLRRRRRR